MLGALPTAEAIDVLSRQFKEAKMSRNLIYFLCMSVIGTAIIAVMVFGIGTAFSVMFLGGLVDIYTDYQFGIWSVDTVKSMTKVGCSGLVALLSVWAIKGLLSACDWLCRWKVGKA